jgi:hypothetical protein
MVETQSSMPKRPSEPVSLPRAPFPDQGNESTAVVHADETALVGFALTRMHPGSLKHRHEVMEPI